MFGLFKFHVYFFLNCNNWTLSHDEVELTDDELEVFSEGCSLSCDEVTSDLWMCAASFRPSVAADWVLGERAGVTDANMYVDMSSAASH